MKEIEKLSGIPGMLRPFKQYLSSAGLADGSQIVFYGCPGTCTPFVELLSYAVRDLPLKPVFVPLLDEDNAKSLSNVQGVGIQADNDTKINNPFAVVLMGGLSMPNVPVSAEDAADTISKYDSKVIGICFMSMFEKTGWLEKLNFDLLIDAEIDPVKIFR
ncbi:DUF2124 domain-containing protein [Methanoplanus sp. FWC-SCC4]|uniref:DUF2124 domain-containing protein n=1 Tax=Methanochimaera problematica TaxID=2609417 RepID=A0AA97I3G2_9EURY|nr:DUF2124 domain-containing protein [Methanoplanus sp. FWC-SCC4]WOF16678.1 DUF2124 domain-containing protein [Methanoplanus sp. FWC-SCC4]